MSLNLTRPLKQEEALNSFFMIKKKHTEFAQAHKEVHSWVIPCPVEIYYSPTRSTGYCKCPNCGGRIVCTILFPFVPFDWRQLHGPSNEAEIYVNEIIAELLNQLSENILGQMAGCYRTLCH
jgi:hypothetical protein